MVAPFVGCTIGGSTYDLFLYAGTESPLSFGGMWAWMRGFFHKKRRSDILALASALVYILSTTDLCTNAIFVNYS